jgi:hypothetical protein
MWYDTDVLEDHAASIFRVQMVEVQEVDMIPGEVLYLS